jgi:hypothetical protein
MGDWGTRGGSESGACSEEYCEANIMHSCMKELSKFQDELIYKNG